MSVVLKDEMSLFCQRFIKFYGFGSIENRPPLQLIREAGIRYLLLKFNEHDGEGDLISDFSFLLPGCMHARVRVRETLSRYLVCYLLMGRLMATAEVTASVFSAI